MKAIRNQAKENAKNIIENNINRLNETRHQTHIHCWIEVRPDGVASIAEEADMTTIHLYNGHELANVLDIACCEHCDCDACASYRQAKDPDIDDDTFRASWGYDRSEVSGNFAQHLDDCEAFDYDMADEVEEAIGELPFGYFADETACKIDYTEGSGSGCDTIFESREEAERHMNLFYTDKEREGLVVVEGHVDINGDIID